ncbi:MAG: hypothetical protein RLY97_1309 [Pseudomonadota bacterium]|jgi:shikimate kinase
MDLEPPSTPQSLIPSLLARIDRPIALVGMMGVGKSSLGRRLANLLDLPFFDADDEIEKAAAMSIPEIFATYDEAYFRAGERRVIARLIEPAGSTQHPAIKVIATGGGAFCNPDTRALILQKTIAIWLDADLETLVDRTSRKDNRPLLAGGNTREKLIALRESRREFYVQAPIHILSSNVPHHRTLMQVVQEISNWLDTHPIPDNPPL